MTFQLIQDASQPYHI